MAWLIRTTVWSASPTFPVQFYPPTSDAVNLWTDHRALLVTEMWGYGGGCSSTTALSPTESQEQTSSVELPLTMAGSRMASAAMLSLGQNVGLLTLLTLYFVLFQPLSAPSTISFCPSICNEHKFLCTTKYQLPRTNKKGDKVTGKPPPTPQDKINWL